MLFAVKNQRGPTVLLLALFMVGAALARRALGLHWNFDPYPHLARDAALAFLLIVASDGSDASSSNDSTTRVVGPSRCIAVKQLYRTSRSVSGLVSETVRAANTSGTSAKFSAAIAVHWHTSTSGSVSRTWAS